MITELPLTISTYSLCSCSASFVSKSGEKISKFEILIELTPPPSGWSLWQTPAWTGRKTDEWAREFPRNQENPRGDLASQSVFTTCRSPVTLFWNVSMKTCLRMNWRVEISFLQRSPICASYTWEIVLNMSFINTSKLRSPPHCKYQKGSSKRRWNCLAIQENRLYWRGSTPRGQ